MSEIASSLFESVLFVVFLTIFLEQKGNKKIIYLDMLVCAGFLFGNITISDYFSIFSVYTILIDLVIMLLYWKMCLKGTFLKFFMGFALYYFGIYFRAYIAFFVFSHIDSELISVVGADNSLDRKICVLFSQFILLLYVIIILYNRNKFFYEKNKVMYLCYFIFPIIALTIFTSMMSALSNLYHMEPQLGIQIIGTMIGFLFMLMLIIYLSFNASRKQEKEREAANLNKLMEIQKESIERFIQQEKESHKIKHDLEQKIYSIRYLIQQNKLEEATAIFKKMITEMYGASKNMTVAQNIVDTVISNKELKYISSGVMIQKDISYFDDSIMDLVDLCILLGNLADNAIEAASMSAAKKVMFNIKEQKNCLHIQCINTFSEEYSDIHKFSSKKEESWKHGFGMQSIREIVDKYHGEFWIDVEKDYLRQNIVITG